GPSNRPSGARWKAVKSRKKRLAPAVLRDLVESLRQALQREGVDGLGALGRNTLDRDIGRAAHGLHHGVFLGRVLDPESVALGVHRVGRAADVDRRFRTGLQLIAN